jgi:hypothetical protein
VRRIGSLKPFGEIHPIRIERRIAKAEESGEEDEEGDQETDGEVDISK